MKITSLVFWVQENELSAKFYKKLGFDIVQSDERNTTVAIQDFQIMLVNMRDEEQFARDSLDSDKGRGMYVYIRVDDVDTKYRELVDAGLAPTSEPKDWEWGNREFVIKDPDGYKLCFWQPIS